jgi:hypothetical protein
LNAVWRYSLALAGIAHKALKYPSGFAMVLAGIVWCSVVKIVQNAHQVQKHPVFELNSLWTKIDQLSWL